MRILLVVLTSFLSLTAVGGGICLLFGWNTPPLEFLRGSPFTSYLVPGLALTVLVGGSAATAAILLILRSGHALTASLATAIAILIFETVEVLVVGSPPGVARNLQLIYFAVGFTTGALTLGAWVAENKRPAAN